MPTAPGDTTDTPASALIIINATIPFGAIKPRHRYFSTLDPDISYPDNGSTISGTVLFILVFVLPAVVITGVTLSQRAWVDWHHAILCYAEAFGLASGWKRWMNLVGVLRPHWLATLATGEDSKIQDGRQSYPSGHSAYMFFSMTLLTLFAFGRTRILVGPSKGHFAKALLCLTPIVLATYVAMTRIADYQHHPADVNAGCVIGILSGAFAYTLNYHSPLGERSGVPKTRSNIGVPQSRSPSPTETAPSPSPSGTEPTSGQPGHKPLSGGLYPQDTLCA
ncbi:MAG: hypothetical protein WDW36_009371 [Sanguina aurantia]